MESYPFKAIAEVLEVLGELGGVSLCFKVRDPLIRLRMPASLGQHRCAYCLGVKQDPGRLDRCVEADDAVEDLAVGGERRRICPFGVEEWVGPVQVLGELKGVLMLGSFRRSKGNAEVPHGWLKTYRQMPPAPSGGLKLLRLGIQALEGVFLKHSSPTSFREANQWDARVVQAVQIMERECRISLRLEDIAPVVGLSPSRMVHIFMETTGKGIRKYNQDIVLQRAAKYLAETSDPIRKIAADLGYLNQNHFSSSFRHRYGIAPKFFRQRISLSKERP